jgi:protein gp37
MEYSSISWTDQQVSPECNHCYADFLVSKRMERDFTTPWRTKTWRDPVKWNAKAPEMEKQLGRRVRVFCASLTDFFLEEADQWRGEAWEVIRQNQNLAFLILTKRPSLIEKRLPADWGSGYPNVWLGTTCGVRSSYTRVDVLRTIPARVRFISAEPLLESVADINLSGIHWLIAGGESGPKYRQMEEAWAVELRDLCRKMKVAFHFKQHSGFRPATNPLLAGRQHHESPLVQKWPPLSRK